MLHVNIEQLIGPTLQYGKSSWIISMNMRVIIKYKLKLFQWCDRDSNIRDRDSDPRDWDQDRGSDPRDRDSDPRDQDRDIDPWDRDTKKCLDTETPQHCIIQIKRKHKCFSFQNKTEPAKP